MIYTNFQIEKSVGRGGDNLPLDVITIQNLLNHSKKSYPNQSALIVDGRYGNKTATQIELFQKHVVGLLRPDARVDPQGKTFLSLIEHLNKSHFIDQRISDFINRKTKINVKRYVNLYHAQNPKQKNLAYLERLVDSINRDPEITDLRWVAYMLATVQWECAGTWQPIEEFGKGKGYAYGKAIDAVDPSTGKTLNNIYYGRGYVQLTWSENYKKLGQELGVGDQLYLHPEKALEHNVAYKILSHGMRKGSFIKGHSLAIYLSGKKTDFLGARKIINGNDKKVEIAK